MGRKGRAGSEQLCLGNTWLVHVSEAAQGCQTPGKNTKKRERGKDCANTAGFIPCQHLIASEGLGSKNPEHHQHRVPGPPRRTRPGPILPLSAAAELLPFQSHGEAAQEGSEGSVPSSLHGYRSTQTPSAGIYPRLSTGFVELKLCTAISVIAGQQTPSYCLRESKRRKEQDYREAP